MKKKGDDLLEYLIIGVQGSIIYLLVFIIFYNYFKYRDIQKENKQKEKIDDKVREEECEDELCREHIPLYIFRNLTFPNNIQFNKCEILTSMYEIFNIFLKLTPSMTTILIKIDKRIYQMKNIIDNPFVEEEDIKREIATIDDLLSQFIGVAQQLVVRYRDIVVEYSEEETYQEVDPQAVREYMKLLNFLVSTAENHSTINYEIHMKIKDKSPELVESFRIIISKTIYLLFIGTITFANAFDKSIYLYDDLDK